MMGKRDGESFEFLAARNRVSLHDFQRFTPCPQKPGFCLSGCFGSDGGRAAIGSGAIGSGAIASVRQKVLSPQAAQILASRCRHFRDIAVGSRLPDRDFYPKLCPFARFRATLQRPLVAFHHNLIGNGEAQPRSLAHRLGGKERVEQARADFIRNAGAIVANADTGPVRMAGGAGQRAGFNGDARM